MEVHSVLVSPFQFQRVCVRDDGAVIKPVLVRMCTARGRHVVVQQCKCLWL